MEKHLASLNPVQLEAVKDYTGPSLIIAGAGSGKTRVLTLRVAYLIEKGIKPWNILALTFTNKAAKEMKERIGSIVGAAHSKGIWMGTFHSIFAKILRREAERLGYSSNFTIYDADDSKKLVRSIIKENKLDDKTYKPNQVFGKISKVKNNLVTPAAYMNNQHLVQDDRNRKMPMIAEIYRQYAMRCKKSDAMDFDDLLLNINILFRDHVDVLARYQERFRYVLVDEYQDTNFAQYLIVNRLAKNHTNLCVVGDDAQSIYSFRGALIENILNFRRDYPDSRTYKLEQNYRSTRLIVDAANSVIKKNQNQLDKVCFSQNNAGDKIQITKNLTDTEEGFTVARQIQHVKKTTGIDYADFAILYRTNAQSRIFEEIMRKEGIPYRIYGGLSFYQRKEIKDVLAYFRLIVNKKDDEAFSRIINYPARGLGKTTVGKIETAAREAGVNLWDVASDPAQFQLGFNQGTLGKLKKFTGLIDVFSDKRDNTDAYDLAMGLVRQAGIFEDLDYKNNPENLSRYENIQELLDSMKEFSDNVREENQLVPLTEYLENVQLLTGDDKEDKEQADKVSLMTIHASKGLEFDTVFIAGVEEDLFPSRMTITNPKELEEERRLFYVAITRAKSRVFLSYSHERYKYGSPTTCSPSRFLRDIDPRFIDYNGDMNQQTESRQTFTRPQNEKSASPSGRFRMLKQKELATANVTGDNGSAIDGKFDDPRKIQSGMQVAHARFGKGKVLKIEGNMPNAKATVYFPDKGQKQLLLKFAKLKIINTT